jgi:Flp pilus assembly pilin Flp
MQTAISRRQKIELGLLLALTAVALIALLTVASFYAQLGQMNFSGINVLGL